MDQRTKDAFVRDIETAREHIPEKNLAAFFRQVSAFYAEAAYATENPSINPPDPQISLENRFAFIKAKLTVLETEVAAL